MGRFRFFAYASCGLFVFILLLSSPARGDGEGKQLSKEKSSNTVTIQVETDSGAILTGTTEAIFRLKTDYGILDLELSKVKAIDFTEDDQQTVAIVELESKHHLHGHPLFESLLLTKKDDSTQELTLEEIREIQVQRPPVDLSLLAALAGLITLAVMEIVLGIDNIIFLAIVVGRLPKEQQPRARKIGLAAALGTRIILLFSLTLLLGLTKAVFTLPIPGMNPDAKDISWRDLILLVGGGFLIVKSVMEMHHKMEESRKKADGTSGEGTKRKTVSFAKIIVQIAIIDIVFSLDSVITAVGMVDNLYVMISAMVIAMLVMLWFSGPISNFVDRYPTVKVLALSFLILIGVLLVAEGMGQHIDKGYVYFAMAFGVGVEMVNIFLQPRGVPEIIAEGRRAEREPEA